jgi:hypothetical protein
MLSAIQYETRFSHRAARASGAKGNGAEPRQTVFGEVQKYFRAPFGCEGVRVVPVLGGTFEQRERDI